MGPVPEPVMDSAKCRRHHRMRRRSAAPLRTRPGSRVATIGSSPEFPRDVEAEKRIVLRAAARQLTDGRADAVRYVDLKHVTADELLDADGPMKPVRVIAGDPRRTFCDDIHGAPQAEPPTHP